MLIKKKCSRIKPPVFEELSNATTRKGEKVSDYFYSLLEEALRHKIANLTKEERDELAMAWIDSKHLSGEIVLEEQSPSIGLVEDPQYEAKVLDALLYVMTSHLELSLTFEPQKDNSSDSIPKHP